MRSKDVTSQSGYIAPYLEIVNRYIWPGHGIRLPVRLAGRRWPTSDYSNPESNPPGCDAVNCRSSPITDLLERERSYSGISKESCIIRISRQRDPGSIPIFRNDRGDICRGN